MYVTNLYFFYCLILNDNIGDFESKSNLDSHKQSKSNIQLVKPVTIYLCIEHNTIRSVSTIKIRI